MGEPEKGKTGEKAAGGGEGKAMTAVSSSLALLVGCFPSFPPQVQLRPTLAAQHQGQQPGKVFPGSACCCLLLAAGMGKAPRGSITNGQRNQCSSTKKPAAPWAR